MEVFLIPPEHSAFLGRMLKPLFWSVLTLSILPDSRLPSSNPSLRTTDPASLHVGNLVSRRDAYSPLKINRGQ